MKRRVRVDFSKMPAYTRPDEYEYRRECRRVDSLIGEVGDYDYDEWDDTLPGNPADYGDR